MSWTILHLPDCSKMQSMTLKGSDKDCSNQVCDWSIQKFPHPIISKGFPVAERGSVFTFPIHGFIVVVEYFCFVSGHSFQGEVSIHMVKKRWYFATISGVYICSIHGISILVYGSKLNCFHRILSHRNLEVGCFFWGCYFIDC